MGMFLAAPRPRDVDDARLRARMRRGSALTSAVAGAAVSGLVLAAVIAPTGFAASASAPYGTSQYASASATQDIELALGTSAGSDRAGFTAEAPPPPPGHTAPAAGIPDPGSAQAYAQGRVAQYGWPAREFDCLVALWNRESHWNAFSHNTSSGAYGIPQALPGEKMASAGADWATNYKTQVEWGLGYILGRYGSPCLAWQHSEDEGWY